MALIIALVRIALSIVFGIAGVTKLLDQPGTREAVNNFGAPKSLAPYIAFLLPIAELAIAVGLLFSVTAWWSALAAMFVLDIFIVAIGVNLARGNTPDCHCFGQIYSRPLGWPTLARNIVFAVAAALVLWNGQSSANIIQAVAEETAALSTSQALIFVGAVIVAAAGLFFFQRRRSRQTVDKNTRPVGLPLDSEAPAFELLAYDGGKTSLSQLLDFGKPVLLIFTNPNCGPCIKLFEEISNWQKAHNDHVTIALITIGTIKDNFVNVARNQLGQVLLQEKVEVSKRYGSSGTPSALVVNRDGRIGSRLAEGADEIRTLLQNYVETAPVSYKDSHHHHSHEPEAQPSPAGR